MQPTKLRPVYLIAAVFAAFTLQLAAHHFNRQFSQVLLLLDYGPRLTSFALLELLCGGLSGAIVALLLFGGSRAQPADFSPTVLALLLSIPPLVALLIKFNTTLNLFHISLRYLRLLEWGVYSQVPPFWLGIIVGWWISKRFLS